MIYLDHAAATPVHPKVLSAMQPYFTQDFFNPSSPYLAAKRVRAEYETAKSALARTIGAKASDLVITAGATESINLAFTALKNINHPHCLILATEHNAVRQAAQQFSSDFVKVNRDGTVDLTDLKTKIQPNTALISIALVNNELGTIQPLAKISELIQQIRQSRLKAQNKTPLFFHSDASQALNLIDVSVARLGVDMLTISAAKIYGPKGIGALYFNRQIKLQPIVFGGGQERGLRSGTENVPALIGFAKAAEIAKSHLVSNRKKYQKLNQILRHQLQQSQIPPLFLGNPKHQLANFCPVSFPSLDAERLIFKLEAAEVYLSTGAACAASKGEKSHTLSAIGLSDSEIVGSLRISLGALNDETNVLQAAQAIRRAVDAEFKRTRENYAQS